MAREAAQSRTPGVSRTITSAVGGRWLGSRRTTVRGNRGGLELAAAGGMDRRSAKDATAPHGSIARSAPPARPLHSPEGRQCYSSGRGLQRPSAVPAAGRAGQASGPQYRGLSSRGPRPVVSADRPPTAPPGHHILQQAKAGGRAGADGNGSPGGALVFVYGYFTGVRWQVWLGTLTLTVSMHTAAVFTYGTVAAGAWTTQLAGYLLPVCALPAGGRAVCQVVCPRRAHRKRSGGNPAAVTNAGWLHPPLRRHPAW
jgi:hypothetical protein